MPDEIRMVETASGRELPEPKSVKSAANRARRLAKAGTAVTVQIGSERRYYDPSIPATDTFGYRIECPGCGQPTAWPRQRTDQDRCRACWERDVRLRMDPDYQPKGR